jgi:hypothetical protein
MQAFRTFLGPCDMLAYLVMMAPRRGEGCAFLDWKEPADGGAVASYDCI